jgi:signal transduction histidine kinase
LTTARTVPHHAHASEPEADPSWRFLVENLPDAVALVDRDGVILLSNGRLGSPQSPAETGAGIYEYLPPGCRGHFSRSLAAAFQSGQPQYFESEEADAEGRPVRHATRVQPLAPDGGEMVNAIVVTTEITRYRAEERVTAARRRQERLPGLTPMAELAAGLSHEVNNPLAVVQGYAEILLDSGLPPGALDQVESIHAAAKRASRIVRELNQVARYGPPTRLPVNLKALVEQCLDLKKQEFASRNVTVALNFPADLPLVLVDPCQVMEALLNILTNAQYAAALAQPAGQVSAGARVLRRQVGLSISDNGPGIAPENISRIFDAFFTTRTTGNGPGLGLSISQAIIRQNGGDLWAESNPGQGATFHLRLPLHRAP